MTIDGLMRIYWLFNYSSDQGKFIYSIFLILLIFSNVEIRKLSGCLIYHLIGDSKELAKYVFDKFCKKAVNLSIMSDDMELNE